MTRWQKQKRVKKRNELRVEVEIEKMKQNAEGIEA